MLTYISVHAVLILTVLIIVHIIYYINVHSILVDGNVLRLTLNPPEESDAGLYTCSLANDSTKNASVLFKVIGKLHLYVYWIIYCLTVDPYFIYGGSRLSENKTALRYHDIFLNCSVYPASMNVAWEFGSNHFLLNTNNENKYTQNSSGLTIYNVTSDDAGLYVCVVGNVNPLEAFISLTVTCKSYIYITSYSGIQ